MSDADVKMPEPFDYCYEWDGPYGTRKFSVAAHNGRRPDRSVPLYTADQLRAAVLAERERWHQDALRYRWLRDTNLSRPDMTDGSHVILAPNEVTAIWYGVPEDQWSLLGGCLQCSKGEKFDAAIDAAIAAAIRKGTP